MVIVISFVNGELILESDRVDLKITRDRKIMKRFPDKNRKGEARGNFKFTGKRLPTGYTRQEKEIWLMNLRNMVVEKLPENESHEEQTKNASEKTEKEEVETDEDEDIEESEGDSEEEWKEKKE